jgi:hypothetical protein
LTLLPGAHPRPRLALIAFPFRSGNCLGSGRQVVQRVSKSGYSHVHQSLGAARKVFQNLSLAASPFFLANAHSQLATHGKLHPAKDIHSRIAMKHDFPSQGEPCPEPIEETAKFWPWYSFEEFSECRTIVQEEDGMGSNKLLYQ